MPEQGLPPLAPAALLTADEVVRIVRIAVTRLGIREVRFTGGEPLLRRDLVEIVAGCAAVAPGVPLAMTTNAVGLANRAEVLAAAGLNRVNISLDTVDRAAFADLTRRDRLPTVLAGIRAAVAAGLTPVKVNAVLMPETLGGATDLVRWCLAEGVQLRFIEEMPLDAEHTWQQTTMVTAQMLLDELSAEFELTPIPRADPTAPAEEWRVDGGAATVGIIASMTRSFCADCDRTRITADGSVRSCLFSDEEVSIRDAMRRGADDTALADLWRDAMWAKPAGHGTDDGGYVRPVRTMGAIGG